MIEIIIKNAYDKDDHKCLTFSECDFSTKFLKSVVENRLEDMCKGTKNADMYSALTYVLDSALILAKKKEERTPNDMRKIWGMPPIE